MNKVLVRLSIPLRLRDGMLLKEGNSRSFDIPHTKEGILFLTEWEKMSSEDHDALMQRAYTENTPLHQTRLDND